jgi:hypothetical protein
MARFHPRVLEAVHGAIRNGELPREVNVAAREAGKKAREIRRLTERTRALTDEASARNRDRSPSPGW